MACVRRALARHTSCLCPTDRLFPLSPSSLSKPPAGGKQDGLKQFPATHPASSPSSPQLPAQAEASSPLPGAGLTGLATPRSLTHAGDRVPQVALLQHLVELGVRPLSLRVQVLPDGATEQKRILGDDGQPRPASRGEPRARGVGSAQNQSPIYFIFSWVSLSA